MLTVTPKETTKKKFTVSETRILKWYTRECLLNTKEGGNGGLE